MKYALLIYPAPDSFEALGEAEQRAVSGEYLAIREDKRVIGGEQLQPVEMATTVRVQGGQTVTTDGPFADTKEILGGFYLLEADDLSAALEVAARIPAARMAGRDRGPPGGEAVALIEQVFRDEWGRDDAPARRARGRGAGIGRGDDPRRAMRAHLHLLPSRVGVGGPDGADVAHPGRASAPRRSHGRSSSRRRP